MCGIAGFFAPPDQTRLESMARAIRHRGPDSQGFFSNSEVSLAIQRLAVIDVENGAQPIYNETEKIVVVFNGEIYNHRTLRDALVQKGHKFKTRSDTEVLVHLYEEKGKDLVQDLNGMYAFALWDDEKKQLLIARDPLGIKPLYYAVTPGRKLWFGSELKSLLALPDISKDIDPLALNLYFSRGSVPAPHTIFSSVKKLRPGHRLIISKGEIVEENFWKWAPVDPKLDFRSAVEMAEAKLANAVKSQLMSDVPLGVFLSGGLDSSAVTYFAAQFHRGPLKTFSIGYGGPDQNYNETIKARRVAQLFGTDHSEFIVSPSLGAELPAIVRSFDEPFANSTALVQHLLCREARAHVTVALTGVGGDEVFGGYPRYAALLLADKFKPFLQAARPLEGLAASLIPDKGGIVNWPGRIKRFLTAAHMPLYKQYEIWTAYLKPPLESVFFNAGWRRPLPDLFQAWGENPSDIARSDLSEYLPSDLLCLADRTSMAHGLEARVPFCDLDLVQAMAAVPLNVKMAPFSFKKILKRVLKNKLPSSILTQSKKGFSIPLTRWLKEDLRPLLDDCLRSDLIKKRGYLNPATVDRLRTEHASGQHNHADILWALLIFELWHREYKDGAGA